MRTPNEPRDSFGDLGRPIRDDKPKNDEFEHVTGHIYRNTKTGQLENRQPFPSHQPVKK